MFRMSDSPLPPGTSTSIATSTITTTSASNVKYSLSNNPQTNTRDTSPTSPNNGQDEDKYDDGSNSSELEEGEIHERDHPPLPPVNKPVARLSPSTRRHGKLPATISPLPIRAQVYSIPPDVEQSLSQREQRNSPALPSYAYPQVPYR